MNTADLRAMAAQVLKDNDLGDSTKPTARLYPHQWLWDSCFIAIGLRHLDPDRAAREVTSLFRGQWANGMLPHVLFSKDVIYHAGPDKWRSDLLPNAPKNLYTSCITQPPVVAEAAVRVGEFLPKSKRLEFYKQIYPGLVRYHEWLYRERDPHNTGLVALIHAWECGIEDTPYWARLMQPAAPLTVKALRSVGQEHLLNKRRPDLKHAPAEDRPSASNFYTLYRLFDKIRTEQYDLARIMRKKSIPVIQDVLYNAVLIRANHHLQHIAADLGEELPAPLQTSIALAPKAFEELYKDGEYWSRDFRTGQLIQEPTAGGLVGLYAGTIPHDRADALARAVASQDFWPFYGITSVPTSSADYQPRRFWQGPVWVNLNWLIADGLKQYDYTELATKLQKNTAEMVASSGGMYEYFSALDGKGCGAPTFSWTAALTIDILATIDKPKERKR